LAEARRGKRKVISSKKFHQQKYELISAIVFILALAPPAVAPTGKTLVKVDNPGIAIQV
jgi:hypothetical protein